MNMDNYFKYFCVAILVFILVLCFLNFTNQVLFNLGFNFEDSAISTMCGIMVACTFAIIDAINKK